MAQNSRETHKAHTKGGGGNEIMARVGNGEVSFRGDQKRCIYRGITQEKGGVLGYRHGDKKALVPVRTAACEVLSTGYSKARQVMDYAGESGGKLSDGQLIENLVSGTVKIKDAKGSNRATLWTQRTIEGWEGSKTRIKGRETA